MTKAEKREHEIDQLILQTEKNLNHIAKRVQDIPYEMNLGTIKAVRNNVVLATRRIRRPRTGRVARAGESAHGVPGAGSREPLRRDPDPARLRRPAGGAGRRGVRAAVAGAVRDEARCGVSEGKLTQTMHLRGLVQRMVEGTV